MLDGSTYEIGSISTAPSSEVVTSKKVLCIPAGYASRVEHMGGLTASLGENNSRQLEFDIVNLFKRKGYIIKKKGNFKESNPEEIGIDHNLIPRMNQLESDKYLSGESGVEMPKVLSLKEVMESDNPVVAKQIGEHGGESIYLLETKEQKARFISWLLSTHNVKSVSQLGELVRQVHSGNFSPISKYSTENDWFFEEYIETPSEFHTSFRVVADCFGKIHYGVLIRSGSEKRTKKIHDVLKISGTELTRDNVIDLTQVGGVELEAILNAPTSPLYLEAKSIVSNALKGGKIIPLNEEVVSDITDRQILLAHHINPDNPQIPNKLIAASSKTGPLCRGDYPFVGIDFLLDENGKFYYLETNLGPAVSPQLIGLPPGSDLRKAQLHLIEKIISSR